MDSINTLLMKYIYVHHLSILISFEKSKFLSYVHYGVLVTHVYQHLLQLSM